MSDSTPITVLNIDAIPAFAGLKASGRQISLGGKQYRLISTKEFYRIQDLVRSEEQPPTPPPATQQVQQWPPPPIMPLPPSSPAPANQEALSAPPSSLLHQLKPPQPLSSSSQTQPPSPFPQTQQAPTNQTLATPSTALQKVTRTLLFPASGPTKQQLQEVLLPCDSSKLNPHQLFRPPDPPPQPFQATGHTPPTSLQSFFSSLTPPKPPDPAENPPPQAKKPAHTPYPLPTSLSRATKKLSPPELQPDPPPLSKSPSKTQPDPGPPPLNPSDRQLCFADLRPLPLQPISQAMVCSPALVCSTQRPKFANQPPTQLPSAFQVVASPPPQPPPADAFAGTHGVQGFPLAQTAYCALTDENRVHHLAPLLQYGPPSSSEQSFGPLFTCQHIDGHNYAFGSTSEYLFGPYSGLGYRYHLGQPNTPYPDTYFPSPQAILTQFRKIIRRSFDPGISCAHLLLGVWQIFHRFHLEDNVIFDRGGVDTGQPYLYPSYH